MLYIMRLDLQTEQVSDTRVHEQQSSFVIVSKVDADNRKFVELC